MQAFILLGSTQNQQVHLDNFQKEHNVPDYLVIKYIESFKIADARTLQKTLGMKLRENETRMIIISNLTLDSQNAILKTLEELPERTYVFFLVRTREDILPTIVSRSSFILLDSEEKTIDEALQKKITEIASKNESVFSLVDILGATLEDKHVEQVLLSLRNVLLQAISQSSPSQEILFSALKTLHENYKLTKSNNINKRLALEASFL